MLFVVTLALFFSACNTNFTRRVYYSEDQNVCMQMHEKVQVSIKFDDGSPHQVVIIEQPSDCFTFYAKYQRLISIVSAFYAKCEGEGDSKYCDLAIFTQKKRVNSVFGDVRSIDAIFTQVVNPISLNGHQYDCKIIGNDGIYPPHFGYPPVYPHPTMEIECERIYETQQNAI